MTVALASTSAQWSGCLARPRSIDGAGHLVAAEHLGADVFLAPLGLALLLLGGLPPDAQQVAAHLLDQLGQCHRLERVERAEDPLDRVQPVDLGRAVAGRERLGQQLLIDLGDGQLDATA